MGHRFRGKPQAVVIACAGCPCYPLLVAQETEIKFHITDLKGVAARLRALGFRQVTARTYENNLLFDFSTQRLRRRGQILRLREFGSDWKLTHKSKGKPGRHKSRAELETKVADGAELQSILAALGLTPQFRYEKYRSEWTDGKGHVVLDETPVGDIGEIEGPPEWIDSVAQKLGIGTEQYITASYAELFRQWKRSNHHKARNMTWEETGTSPRP